MARTNSTKATHDFTAPLDAEPRMELVKAVHRVFINDLCAVACDRDTLLGLVGSMLETINELDSQILGLQWQVDQQPMQKSPSVLDRINMRGMPGIVNPMNPMARIGGFTADSVKQAGHPDIDMTPFLRNMGEAQELSTHDGKATLVGRDIGAEFAARHASTEMTRG